MLKVTRSGEELVIGRWLEVKIIKNSLVESSHTRVRSTLFRYKSGVGFDMGVSYLLALKRAGFIRGDVSMGLQKPTKIIIPGSTKVLSCTFREFHDLLVKDSTLREKFRDAIVSYANENAVMLRHDV